MRSVLRDGGSELVRPKPVVPRRHSSTSELRPPPRPRGGGASSFSGGELSAMRCAELLDVEGLRFLRARGAPSAGHNGPAGSNRRRGRLEAPLPSSNATSPARRDTKTSPGRAHAPAARPARWHAHRRARARDRGWAPHVPNRARAALRSGVRFVEGLVPQRNHDRGIPRVLVAGKACLTAPESTR